MDEHFGPRPKQPPRGENEGNSEEPGFAENTNGDRNYWEAPPRYPETAQDHETPSWSGEHLRGAGPQPPQGEWQPPYPGPNSGGFPAAVPSSYGPSLAKKHHRWPILAAVSLVGVVVVGGVIWLWLGQSKSYDAIAEECENTLNLGLLSIFTGLSEVVEERGDPDSEIWSETPRVITVAGDSSSINVHDRSRMSVDASEILDGLTGSARERESEYVDQWNGMRDFAILGAVGCVHEELKIPDSVEQRMLSTRALDGTQEVVYSGTRITWSYHPSRGLDILYEKE